MNLRSIAEISELIRRGELSPVEITRECLDRVVELNPTLNAFITIMADSALAEATQSESEVRAGNGRGPVHGIPIGLKDIIDTTGVRTTAASAVFGNRTPTADADVVKKLKAAGAIIIGKQNLHEFAYGGSSVISHFGPVRNPANPEFIAGGSSGGSAAAVASGMCYAAIGTDTAGSIREPAGLCGVVGLKPTYGVVSTNGIIPLSVSLDHAGPIARTVEDAAILLDALTDNSGNHRTALKQPTGKLVIGVPRKFFFEDLDADIAAAMENALAKFVQLGAELRDINIPVSTDRTVQAYESYQFHRETVATSADLYQAETLRRIRSGENITAAQYKAALRELRRVRAEISAVFQEIDVMITPTTPIAAPRLSDLMNDTDSLRPTELVLLRNTRPVNVWGLPAISVPCGFSSQVLPIGLQIIGGLASEIKVLRVAHTFEQTRQVASQ